MSSSSAGAEDGAELNSVTSRLRAAKRQIQKLVETSSQPLSSGEGAGNVRRQRHPVMENAEPNSSFHLGMELFGQQDVGGLERVVREKLEVLEGALDGVLRDVTSRGEAGQGSLSSICEDGGDGDEAPRSPEELEAEAALLKAKVVFLKVCSKVRSSLDESVRLAGTGSEMTAALADSAKLLVEARQGMGVAEKMIETQLKSSSASAGTGASGGNPPAFSASEAYKVLDSIRASVRRQKVLLIRRAKTAWEQSVELAPNSLSVRGGSSGSSSSSSSGPSPLQVTYETLETLQDTNEDGSALQDLLRAFVRDLYSTAFLPALDSNKSSGAAKKWTFHESEERSSAPTTVVTTSSGTRGPVRRLSWSADDGDHDETVANADAVDSWSETFAFLQRILSFVANRVLLRRASLCAFVGKRLLGKPDAQPSELNLDVLGIESRRLGDDNGLLLEPLLDRLRSTCIPKTLRADELSTLATTSERLHRFIDPFVESLSSSKLLPPLDSPGAPFRLASFAESVEQLYVDNRRCVILNEARRLLVETDYHNTVRVGEEVPPETRKDVPPDNDGDDGLGIFRLHKCAVSETAHSAMQLCRGTMDEAVECRPRGGGNDVDNESLSPLSLLPAVLYRTAREVLDLFRAMVPVSYGYEIQNVPRTAAAFHNDCVFIAHNCLTLGLEYRDGFAAAAAGTSDQRLGDNDVRGNVLRQTCMFVDMVPLFRNLADKSMGDMLELQAKQIVEIVGERIPLLGAALRSDEILAEWSEAETALTAGIYHLRHLFQAWKPVLSHDILTRSMWYLSDVVFTLFLDQVISAKDISADACTFVGTLFRKASYEIKELVGVEDTSGSRVYDRFDAVGRFMDMSLADIQVGLADGVFRSVTGPELTRLIIATFDDSPKRRNLLDAIVLNND